MTRPEIFDRVREAFDRGRWVMMTDSDGAPQEITLDLKERPDDLLGAERTLDLPEGRRERHAHDDHGPAIPAQDSRPLGELLREAIEGEPEDGWRTFTLGPVVYEFALQDAIGKGDLGDLRPKTLADASVMHAPDFYAAMAADWVHVYDRVTRERRTLKRPPADAVLTGLADVAADLRGQSPAQPAPGPLTSTDGLLRGDVLRVIWAAKFGGMGGMEDGELVRLLEAFGPGKDPAGEAGSVGVWWRGEDHQYHADRFAFVGRPDADGWMDWPGGESPVGDAMVEARYGDGQASRWPCEASKIAEYFNAADEDDQIVPFRLVDMPPLTGDA